jgi:hypothetical protein
VAASCHRWMGASQYSLGLGLLSIHLLVTRHAPVYTAKTQVIWQKRQVGPVLLDRPFTVRSIIDLAHRRTA